MSSIASSRGFVALVALASLAACGSPNPSATPTPTDTLCPPGLGLSYDNFGKPFMEHYCVRCHSSELHGSDRHGAPLYHDFDSLFGILVVANHVDWYTAAGPDSVNEIMPPDGEAPTLDERYQLGEWLACEVDNIGTHPQLDAGPEDAGLADAGPEDAGLDDAALADGG